MITTKSRTPVITALIVLSLTGCSDIDRTNSENHGTNKKSTHSVHRVDQEPDIIDISFGSSFGECEGYCEFEYILHSWGLECWRRGWAIGGDSSMYPTQRQIVPVSQEYYSKVLFALDTTELWSEFKVRQIGCPDCADGGRCWIEVRRGEELNRFDYDCVGGPGPHVALIDIVRDVAKKVRWWEPGDLIPPFN